MLEEAAAKAMKRTDYLSLSKYSATAWQIWQGINKQVRYSEIAYKLPSGCCYISKTTYWLRKLLMSSLEKLPTTTIIELCSFSIVLMMSSCGLRLFVKMNMLSPPEEWLVISTS